MTMLVPRRFGRSAPVRGVRPFSWDLTGFDRLLDDLWGGAESPYAGAPAGFVPHVDVHEAETEYRVTAELPGLEEKDFEVALDGDVLTLKGEKRDEREVGSHGTRHLETRYGSFERRFQLPSDVNADKVAAAFKNGVLTVTLPKTEAARPRSIEITHS